MTELDSLMGMAEQFASYYADAQESGVVGLPEQERVYRHAAKAAKQRLETAIAALIAERAEAADALHAAEERDRYGCYVAWY
jgi:hypothetical protein